MRKYRRIILFITIILLILFSSFIVFKSLNKKHNAIYTINKYKIEENFNDDKYTFIIKKGKKKYVYTLNEKMDKRKKIIESIKELKSNDLNCIIPKYKGSEIKDIHCLKDSQHISLNYLIQTNDNDFLELKEKIEKKGIILPKEESNKKKYKKINIYQNNFQDEKLLLWDYKGIYIISKESSKYQKILNADLYDNIMNVVVDKYYVLFDNTSVNGIEKVYYYDLVKDKLKEFKLDTKLSKKTYINGVVDSLIYLTDKKNKKEYTLSIDKRKLQEIDNNQTEYTIYKNNKKEKISMSDFLIREQIFANYEIDKEIIDYDEILIEDNNYYYLKDNKFYKAINGYEDNAILLFYAEDVKSWNVKNGTIYMLKDNCIYSYNDSYGLKRLVEYNELRYNYKNIYNVWKK